MAFYDVNSAIQKPNMLAMVQQGMAFGTQQRQLREEEKDRMTLRDLTPGAIGGDIAKQDQIAAIDPQRGGQVQDIAAKRGQAFAGWVGQMKQARESGDPRRVSAIYKMGVPLLSSISGQPAPPEWTPELDADFVNLEAMAAMQAQGSAQAQEGKVVGNSLVDPVTGRVIYQGPEVPVNAQVVEIADGRGGKLQVMLDPRTRQTYRIPSPGGTQPPQAPAGGDGINAPTGPVDANSAEQIVRQIEAAQGAPLEPSIRAQIVADVQRNGGRVDTGSFSPAVNRPRTIDQVPITELGGGAIGAPAGGFGYTAPEKPETPDAVVTLTPDEVIAAGFPAGSVVQRRPDGTLVKTFSPTERDANGGRALPANVVNELSKDAEKLVTLTDLAASFKDGFAGNVVGGSIENAAGRLGGERVGITTRGQSEWWQQYDRLKNVVRNELFGAALTATEQAAFEAADITPNMDPKIVTSNLKKQADIVRRALERKAAVWKSQGYNPDAVINATAVPSAAPGASAADMSDDEIKKALNL